MEPFFLRAEAPEAIQQDQKGPDSDARGVVASTGDRHDDNPTSPRQDDVASFKAGLPETGLRCIVGTVKEAFAARNGGGGRGGQSPSVLIICGRTADNPALFRDAVAHGAKHILLEKPGASTLEELLAMRDLAREAGVSVTVNFQKHVSPYVKQ